MKKAKAFKNWYKERQDHTAQLKAALEAIEELERNMCIYAREHITGIDFYSDDCVLGYFADEAERFNRR